MKARVKSPTQLHPLDPKPSELTMARVNLPPRKRRPEPVPGAKGWDELWLGVICLSSSEIAGSPRNIFGYSLPAENLPGVEHWKGYLGVSPGSPTKLRIPEGYAGESDYGC